MFLEPASSSIRLWRTYIAASGRGNLVFRQPPQIDDETV
jgi:hypothetical protein